MPDHASLPELRAKALKGDPASQAELGLHYAHLEGHAGVRRNPSAAIRWLEKSAAQGYAPAEWRLGMLLLKHPRRGEHEDADRARGAAILWGLVDRQVPAVEFMMANFLALGIHVPRDEPKARELLERAADHGHSVAIAMQKKLAQTPGLSVSHIDTWRIVRELAPDRAPAGPRLH